MVSQFYKKFSNEILNLLLESVDNGVYITDINGKILWVNKYFTNITGYSFEEILGKNPKILKSGIHDQNFYKNLWDTINSGNIWKKTLLNKRKNGTKYFQETTISPVKNGKINHFIAVIQDVTERKNIEKELLNKERLFRTLFNSSPVPTVIIDIDNFKILKANEEWIKLISYNSAEENFYQWKDDNQLKEIIKKAKINEEIPATEFQIIKKDKTIKDFIFIGKIIEFQNKECLLCINLDITKQKKIQLELEKSKIRYKHLFEKMLDGFASYEVIRDENGKVIDYKYVLVNDAFLKLTGLKKDIIGKRVKELFPNTKKEWIKLFGKVVDTGIPVKYENNASGKHWNVIAYKIEDNQFACISRDITEKIKHEKKLKKLADSLQEAHNDLEDFIYIASHDLKEPLRKIKILSEFIFKDESCNVKCASKNKKYPQYLNEASSRMINLIDDLLKFSKASRSEVSKKYISIESCVKDAIDILDQKIENKNAKIIVNLKINKKIRGDQTLITHVFQNLISNALKFNNKEPIIEISYEKIKNKLIFTVKDNGIGINKEYSNKIFEPLKRLHNKDEYPGSGIGLSICKKIIEKHNGKIWVESEITKGSCFKFTIGDQPQ